MSDAYPLPKNIPQGPQLDATSLPPANGVTQQIPDFAKMVATRAPASPNYQALKGPQQPASFGAAGLPGFAQLIGSIPGATPAMAGLGSLAATGAGMAAPLAAAAYGVGKLVAPKWTDETVGKIKDYIAQKVAEPLKTAEAIGSAQEVGMGEAIPGTKALQKYVLPQQVSQYLDVIKNQHPFAANMGRLSGTAGLMAIPGVNAIAGGGLGATLGNAAINAAPFAIGQGLDVGATTGDPTKAVLSGLGTEALGTALPAVGYGLSKIPAVNRWLTKIQLAGAGLRTGDEVKNLRSYATHTLGLRGPAVDSYVAKQSEPLQEKLGGLVDQFGQGRAGKEAMREWNNNGFDAHNAIYEAVTGNHVTTDIGNAAGMSDADHVLQDPDLLDEVTGLFTPEQIQASVKKIGGMIDGQSWNRSRNTILGKIMQDGRGDLTGQKGLDAAVAQAWHNQVDSVADRAMTWAKQGALGPEAKAAAAEVPDLLTLKSTYPAIQTVKRAQAREEPKIPTNFAPGSDTFARAATDAILQGGSSALGGALGGPLGAVAGHVAGPILSRAIGKGMEKGAGAAAGGLKNLLKNIPEMPSAALGRGAMEAAPILGQMNGPTMPTGTTLGGATPDQGQQGPAPAAGGPSPAPSPEQAPAPPGAQPIPNAVPDQVQPIPIPPATSLSPQDQAQIQFNEAGKPQEPAKVGPWNSTFADARIHEKYMRHVRQYGQSISEEQYRQAVLAGTDNLNPLNPTTWKGMFDDPTTADRYFNAYVNLQKIKDVDPGSALNHYTRLFQLGQRIAPAAQFKENEDNAKLVQALSDMTKQTPKDIDNRLRLLAWDKGKSPEQKKQAVLDMIVKEGGVDVPLFVKMGLW